MLDDLVNGLSTCLNIPVCCLYHFSATLFVRSEVSVADCEE